ncbi:MAG: hypothetical protein JSS91_02185 [Bacteroidetes bacterium]|nr:hypothetical protein [Bacteroidota bacterium]
MLKSSLLEILRTFTKQELIKFGDFVRSPYFNKKENVTKLFLEIKKYAPEYSNEMLGKELIWGKLFPGNEYNYGIMKNIIFDLNKLAVSFLDLEIHSGKKFDPDLNIIEQYQLRGLSAFAEKKIKECKNELKKLNIDSDYYLYNYLFETKEIDHMPFKHDLKEFRSFEFNEFNKNLSLYFYTMFFEKNYNSYQLSFLYNKPINNKNIDVIIKSYEESEFRNFYSDIVFFAFKTVYDPYSEINYYKLKDLYYQNFDKLSKKNKYNFAAALSNFCKNNSNAGNLFFIKERYQYSKLFADHELFFFDNNKYIDRFIFMNIVISACTAGDFDWCEQFIKKYESKLKKDIKELSVNFAYIHLNFKSKKYNEAMNYLSKCLNVSGMDKYNIKTYQVFLYYEMEYYEELKYLTDTCRHFVKNDKTVSDDYKKQFEKFVNIANKLSDYRYNMKNKGKDEFVLNVIKKYITGNEMQSKNWLNEKISELEN